MAKIEEKIKNEQEIKKEDKNKSQINMNIQTNDPRPPPLPPLIPDEEVKEEKPHSKSLNDIPEDNPTDEDNEEIKRVKEKTPTKGNGTAKPPASGERAKKRHSVASGNAESELKLKRRKINIAGAPKMPLTGYVRFMNERRVKLRREMPNKTSLEHTKIIGLEWTQMSMELKQPYLKAAAEAKEQYLNEIKNFFDEHPDLLANELAKDKQATSKKNATSKEKAQNTNNKNKNQNNTTEVNTSSATKTDLPQEEQQQQTEQEIKPVGADSEDEPLSRNKLTSTPVTTHTTNNGQQSIKNNGNGNGITTITNQNPYPSVPTEIQIFTNEFLEHNRNLDAEIRTLRKQNSDLEQHNALLDKHVENTSVGLAKINNEIADLKEQNRLLNQYLTQTKEKLIGVFSSLPLPTERSGATAENFDKYIEDLYNMAASNIHSPALNKARDIIRKLELPVRTKM